MLSSTILCIVIFLPDIIVCIKNNLATIYAWVELVIKYTFQSENWHFRLRLKGPKYKVLEYIVNVFFTVSKCWGAVFLIIKKCIIVV